MSTVEVDTVEYEGWEHCLRVTNGTVELIATTEVGPRIVHFGFVGGRNELYLDDEDLGETDGEEWRLYGGHRLWHAPEDAERTLRPDNDPLSYEITDDGCVLTQPTEQQTGMAKEIAVEMSPDDPAVELTHRITNEGLWPVPFAPWGITMLAPGGKAIVPLPEGDFDARQPDRSLTLWPYTNPGDGRLEWIDDHLLVRQDDGEKVKIGASGGEEWTAYVNDGHALLKTFEWDPEATYPDMHSGIEVFTVPEMLELETLVPERTIEPGETATHVETWELLEGVSVPETGADVDAMDLP